MLAPTPISYTGAQDGRGWNLDQRTVSWLGGVAHINKVEKFMASDSEFESVQTLYGVGYRFKET